MGKRRDQQAYHLVRRGNRRRLRSLFRRHPELLTPHSAMLVFAAIWHNRAMLRWLLECGVSPDCRMGANGNSPFMQAAAEGDLATMKMLLKFGADPNLLDDELSTNALGFAVAFQQVPSIEFLAGAGVDLNGTEDSGPGRTQLNCAEQSGWTEVADCLRRLGGRRFEELQSP